MFVRWKKRKAAPERRHSFGIGPHMSPHWVVVVVESKRLDGKPRQKIVMYLASIADDVRGHEYSQVEFWLQAMTKLDALSVAGEQRARMEAALLRIVPRPTLETTARIEAELATRQRRRK